MSQNTQIGRRLSVLTDAFRAQLWPIPGLAIVVAIALGVSLPLLDGHIDDDLPGGVRAYLVSGGAGAARAVLGAVAGSLVTMTSLTFSLTVVTLQLASGQFSPRLLRTFTSDRVVHATLALFLATFVYTLTVRAGRRPRGAVQVDGVSALPGDRSGVRTLVEATPGRARAGLPVPGRQHVQDARRCPRRTGARGLGHHHRRRPGVRRARRRRQRVHRRVGRLPRRAHRPWAAPAAAGHLRRRARADQRVRVLAAAQPAPALPDPPVSELPGEGACRGADRDAPGVLGDLRHRR